MAKIILSIVLALGVVSMLAGCGDGSSSYDKRQQREERMYEFCVSHGGSWHTDSWSESEECTLPKTKKDAHD